LKNDWKSILSNKNGILPIFGDSTYGKCKYDGPSMNSAAHDDLDLQVPMQTEYIRGIGMSIEPSLLWVFITYAFLPEDI
jgi:hypothetical protein